jgi:acyl-CoA dehydrogenase
LRILTPTLKFRATRDARKVCGDALEMRGGIGYVEEFASARVLRDSYLGSIWEGTSNIVALDAITRAIGRHGADSALAADLHARLKEPSAIPQGYRDTLKRAIDRAIQFAATVAASSDNEGDARRATTLLYHTASAVTLAWEGAQLAERRGDARRLLLSRLVVDHHLTPTDPYAIGSGSREREIADALFSDQPMAANQVATLLASR